jgi:hypothetical protein
MNPLDKDIAYQIIAAMDANRHLNYAVLALVFVMFLKEVFIIARLIRRALGIGMNAIDPLDDLTGGQFIKAMIAHELSQATGRADAVTSIGTSLNAHFTALKALFEKQQKNMNLLLLVQRDVRAYLVYGEKVPRRTHEQEEGEAQL